jgi:hypothetical protein
MCGQSKQVLLRANRIEYKLPCMSILDVRGRMVWLVGIALAAWSGDALVPRISFHAFHRIRRDRLFGLADTSVTNRWHLRRRAKQHTSSAELPSFVCNT